MQIGGFQKTSLLDYSDKVSAIVFTVGCNFRCPFCQNQDLVLGDLALIPEDEVFAHLRKRRRVLDGVVITGGEPTIQGDLPEFIGKIRELNLLVKLDTNGSNPEVLESLLRGSLLDYVAVDFKLPLKRYEDLFPVSGDLILRTMEILRRDQFDYEFRTTVVPGLLSQSDLIEMAETLRPDEEWYLQQFRPQNCLDPDFENLRPYSRIELEKMLRAVREFVPAAELRGI